MSKNTTQTKNTSVATQASAQDFGTNVDRIRRLNERKREVERKNARKLKAAGYNL